MNNPEAWVNDFTPRTRKTLICYSNKSSKMLFNISDLRHADV